jgi:hypothetical protein
MVRMVTKDIDSRVRYLPSFLLQRRQLVVSASGRKLVDRFVFVLDLVVLFFVLGLVNVRVLDQ